jgi:hypothetical protein
VIPRDVSDQQLDLALGPVLAVNFLSILLKRVPEHFPVEASHYWFDYQSEGGCLSAMFLDASHL